MFLWSTYSAWAITTAQNNDNEKTVGFYYFIISYFRKQRHQERAPYKFMCILTYSSLLNETDRPPQFKANHYSFKASYHKSFTLFSQALFSIDSFTHKLSLAFKTANPPTVQSSALFFPSQPCFLSQDTLSPLFHLPFTFNPLQPGFSPFLLLKLVLQRSLMTS